MIVGGDRPTRFRDGHGDMAHYYGAPWGAIVDGYQMIDTWWHRIDRAEDIDLDAFRQTDPVFAGYTLDDAFAFAQASIGELERQTA